MSQPINTLTLIETRAALAKLRGKSRDDKAGLEAHAASLEGVAQGKPKRARVSALRKVAPRQPKPVLPRFAAALEAAGLPLPVTEYRFSPDRLWRFDYAWPSAHVALEVDGGIWVNGGHNRGAQMLKTWEKENTAQAIYGWRILRCEPKGLCSPDTLRFIAQALIVTAAMSAKNS